MLEPDPDPAKSCSTCSWFQARLKALKEILAEQQQVGRAAQARNLALERECEQHSRRLERSAERICQLENQASRSAGIMQRVKEQSIALEEANAREAGLERERSHMTQLVDKNQQLSHQLSQTEHELAELKQSHAEVKKLATASCSKLAAVQSKSSQLEQSEASMAVRLLSSQRQTANLEEQLIARDEEIVSVGVLVEQLREELGISREELSLARHTADQLRQQLDSVPSPPVVSQVQSRAGSGPAENEWYQEMQQERARADQLQSELEHKALCFDCLQGAHLALETQLLQNAGALTKATTEIGVAREMVSKADDVKERAMRELAVANRELDAMTKHSSALSAALNELKRRPTENLDVA
eukprot:TRINITY_DN2080_c0_g1_i4.p2 TRINITY_DN2080_c0_g1~~TRINITY_DN2080_c0_g1_i4.p2  ORF type:complete len:359 (+),score=98.78 TRINITY_DN2080_c0_g1_i4:250-1326(+)